MEGPGTGPVTHWDLAKIEEVPWVIKRMMQGETQTKKAGKLCRVIKRHKVCGALWDVDTAFRAGGEEQRPGGDV